MQNKKSQGGQNFSKLSRTSVFFKFKGYFIKIVTITYFAWKSLKIIGA